MIDSPLDVEMQPTLIMANNLYEGVPLIFSLAEAIYIFECNLHLCILLRIAITSVDQKSSFVIGGDPCQQLHRLSREVLSEQLS